MKLTKEDAAVLRVAAKTAFCGFPTGSNLWPLCELQTDEGAVDGEVVEKLLRDGLLTTQPIGEVVAGERSPDHDYAPDLDFEHEVLLTPAGRAALQSERQTP